MKIRLVAILALFISSVAFGAQNNPLDPGVLYRRRNILYETVFGLDREKVFPQTIEGKLFAFRILNNLKTEFPEGLGQGFKEEPSEVALTRASAAEPNEYRRGLAGMAHKSALTVDDQVAYRTAIEMNLRKASVDGVRDAIEIATYLRFRDPVGTKYLLDHIEGFLNGLTPTRRTHSEDDAIAAEKDQPTMFASGPARAVAAPAAARPVSMTTRMPERPAAVAAPAAAAASPMSTRTRAEAKRGAASQEEREFAYARRMEELEKRAETLEKIQRLKPLFGTPQFREFVRNQIMTAPRAPHGQYSLVPTDDAIDQARQQFAMNAEAYMKPFFTNMLESYFEPDKRDRKGLRTAFDMFIITGDFRNALTIASIMREFEPEATTWFMDAFENFLNNLTDEEITKMLAQRVARARAGRPAAAVAAAPATAVVSPKVAAARAAAAAAVVRKAPAKAKAGRAAKKAAPKAKARPARKPAKKAAPKKPAKKPAKKAAPKKAAKKPVKKAPKTKAKPAAKKGKAPRRVLAPAPAAAVPVAPAKPAVRARTGAARKAPAKKVAKGGKPAAKARPAAGASLAGQPLTQAQVAAMDVPQLLAQQTRIYAEIKADATPLVQIIETQLQPKIPALKAIGDERNALRQQYRGEFDERNQLFRPGFADGQQEQAIGEELNAWFKEKMAFMEDFGPALEPVMKELEERYPQSGERRARQPRAVAVPTNLTEVQYLARLRQLAQQMKAEAGSVLNQVVPVINRVQGRLFANIQALSLVQDELELHGQDKAVETANATFYAWLYQHMQWLQEFAAD